MNTPVFPLMFLAESNQSRFRFTRSNHRAPNATSAAPTDGAFRVATEMWAIEYQEVAHDTHHADRAWQGSPGAGSLLD